MLLLIDSKKYYSQHIQINSVTMKKILLLDLIRLLTKQSCQYMLMWYLQ